MINKEQIAFEKWAVKNEFYTAYIDETKKEYFDCETQSAWEAWQARAALDKQDVFADKTKTFAEKLDNAISNAGVITAEQMPILKDEVKQDTSVTVFGAGTSAPIVKERLKGQDTSEIVAEIDETQEYLRSFDDQPLIDIADGLLTKIRKHLTQE